MTQTSRRSQKRSAVPKMAAVAASLALFATACGSAATDTSVAPAPEAAVESAESSETGGAGLPVLVGDTVAGSQLSTNDLADQDVVVWFWAPW